MINDKQKRFALAYLENGNKSRLAYKFVYGDHLSDNVADAAASRLLSDVKVREFINKTLSATGQVWTVEENEEEIISAAARRLLTKDGRIAAIASIASASTQDKDRLVALKMLGDIHGDTKQVDDTAATPEDYAAAVQEMVSNS